MQTPQPNPDRPRILVVEEDPSTDSAIAPKLSESGARICHVSTCVGALQVLKSENFCCVVIDSTLPNGDFSQLQAQIHSLANPPTLVIVANEDDIRQAEGKLRAQSDDYAVNAERYIDPLAPGVSERLAVKRTVSCTDNEKPAETSLLLGRSDLMRRLRARIERAGARGSTVLITGETGTGKELTARALHQASPVRKGPFVPANCAAIVPGLFESELFGSARGAYTGAEHDRSGLFGAARGGTLFLDEIGELPLEAQAKLLRVLEDGHYRRVGDTREQRAEARVIVATNRDLERAAQDGTFRWDLYYRLDVLRIHLPPLRQRLDDIPTLLDHFLDLEFEGPERRPHVTRQAILQLRAHAWPGNVRELKHAVTRTVTWNTNACIEAFELASPSLLESSPLNRHEIGWSEIAGLLTRYRGRLSHVAKELGISVRTLQRRMRELGMDRGAFEK